MKSAVALADADNLVYGTARLTGADHSISHGRALSGDDGAQLRAAHSRGAKRDLGCTALIASAGVT